MLHGIPILIKDNYNTSDIPTTGASVALANFVPNQNSTQVVKLLDAGAILIAKTNLHEFAYGITSVSSLVGQTRNPYDHRRVPGGSSGGTGAAVAASFGAAGMGSDTCGSIRSPRHITTCTAYARARVYQVFLESCHSLIRRIQVVHWQGL